MTANLQALITTVDAGWDIAEILSRANNREALKLNYVDGEITAAIDAWEVVKAHMATLEAERDALRLALGDSQRETRTVVLEMMLAVNEIAQQHDVVVTVIK